MAAHTEAPAVPTMADVINQVIGEKAAKAEAENPWNASEVVEVADVLEGDAPPAEGEEGVEATEEVIDEVADVEEVLDEAPAVVRLKEFRTAEGALNEEEAEKALELHKASTQTVQAVNDMLASSPTLRKEWAKAMKAKGYTLSPEYEALLVPEAPAKPTYTMKQIEDGYNKARAQGATEFQLQRYWDTYVTQPREEARNAAVAEDRKKIADAEAARQKAVMEVEGAKLLAAQVDDATRAFASVAKKTKEGWITITDPKVAAAYNRIDKEFGPKHPVTVKRILELALLECGKLGKKAPAAAVNTQIMRRSKPALNAAPRRREEGHLYTPQIEILQKK